MKSLSPVAYLSVIEKLEADILRIRCAQETMVNAERALREGRPDILRELGFADEHIEDLKAAVRSGRAAFPRESLSNNRNLIRYLRRKISQLRKSLDADAETSMLADADAVDATEAIAAPICIEGNSRGYVDVWFGQVIVDDDIAR